MSLAIVRAIIHSEYIENDILIVLDKAHLLNTMNIILPRSSLKAKCNETACDADRN